MLLKLWKHELKAQRRLYGGIYLIVALLGIIALIFYKLNEINPGNIVFHLMQGLSFFILMVAIVVMFVGTFIIAILRYRNNLLKDEGYLMHTLPITVKSLYISKLVTSLVWLIADMILAYVMISLSSWDFTWLGSILNPIQEKNFFHFTTIHYVGIIVYILVMANLFLNSIYVSLSVGFSSAANKDVMSFVTFIGTYMISQISNMIGLVAVCIIKFGSFSSLFAMETIDFSFLRDTIICVSGIQIILSIAFALVSGYLLKNRLNLE